MLTAVEDGERKDMYRYTYSVSMLAAMEDGAGDGGGKLWVSHMGAPGCGGLKQ